MSQKCFTPPKIFFSKFHPPLLAENFTPLSWLPARTCMNPLQIVPFELPHFLQLGLFNYFGESLIAKINILLDCLFYVTQEKGSH